MSLCRVCQAFDIQSFTKTPNQTKGFHIESLEKSASKGCPLCQLFSRSLRHDIEKSYTIFKKTNCWMHLKIAREEIKVPEGNDGLGYSRLNVYIAPFPMLGLELKCIESSIEFCLVAEEDSQAARNGDIIGRYLDVRNPISDSHISAIQFWIDTCHAEHAICNEKTSPDNAPLPTRCIEIHPDHLALQETGGKSERYVILSHRWDWSTGQSRTLKENYKERREGFQATLLPLVFQDAIEVTRRMNIRYIWIDSLCIVQDGDDWEIEAMQMSQYYQNASFTIGAVALSESADQQRILFPRELPWKSNLVRLPYLNRDGGQEGYFYIFERSIPLEEDFETHISESSLLKRGWVIQERILSPRIVYFTKTRMFFECRHHVESEAREILIRKFPRKKLQAESNEKVESSIFENVISTKLMPFSKRGETGEAWDEKMFENWYRVIENYSNSTLTKPEKDRMVAIAGVAKEYKAMLEKAFIIADSEAPEQQQIAFHYMWGLWLQDIAQGLLWQVWDFSPVPSNCGAPSWSWASTCSAVKWLPQDFHANSRRTECQITHILNDRGDVYDVSNLVLSRPSTSSSGLFTRLLSKKISYLNQAERTFLTTDMPSAAFNTTSQFSESQAARLRIKGSLQGIVVSESHYFEHRDDQFDRLEDLTASRSSREDRKHWRAVMSHDAPNIIIGWASLDHLPTNVGAKLYALHISTRKKVPGGFRIGLASWYREVYDIVLMIRTDENNEPPKYQRIGAGNIFKINFFQDVNPIIIELI